MRKILLLAVPFLLASHPAPTATASGPGALALAALVAQQSPLASAGTKAVLAHLLDGQTGHDATKGKITVRADSVVCRASDVDITHHDCNLAFGKRTVMVTGRKAHELYATVAEVGVPPDGTAGSIYESLSQLACTIDPHTIAQKAGGGADCTFNPGPP